MPTLLLPRFWGGHLLMVVCVAVAVALGLWQYDAWGARRQDEAKDLANVAAVPLSSLMSGDSAFPGDSLGQPVSFTGSWLPAGTVYVAGRVLHGRTGYWVVTPVLVGRSAMPVVRGWSAKPTAPPPSGQVSVTGWLQASEGNDSVDSDPHDDVLPSMRVASIVEHVDADLYSGYVVARRAIRTGSTAPSGTEGVSAVTPAAIPSPSSFTALRNLIYAIQWWIFGGFAVFVWVRWCRDVLEVAETVTGSGDPEGPDDVGGPDEPEQGAAVETANEDART